MSKAKIVMLGAGSVVFSKNVIADILWHDALKDSEICLVDIDDERLEAAKGMTANICRLMDVNPVITVSKDRRTVLEGADFVICCIGVGGYKATEIDHKIPAEFGLKQTVGDTLGVGGIFRSIRSIPVLLEICEDIKELCPDALLINYTNPMSMHCLAVERATDVKHVGICHGVSNTAQTMRMITCMLEEPPAVIETHFKRPYGDPVRNQEWAEWMEKGNDPQLHYTCAGVNHMAFFLKFMSDEEDLYPKLWQVFENPHMLVLDPTRFALFKRLGYFMTETSGHTAEYVSYMLKDDAEIEKHNLWISSYLNTCQNQDRMYQEMRAQLAAGEAVINSPYTPSNEYASRIINAVVTGIPYVFNGNVHNRGGAVISNLPGDSCVEVPCVADREGIKPTVIGDLPPQCAAMIRTNINVQDLTVRGIIEGKRDHIRHAVMMDPNTSSQLSLDTMDDMLEAMFNAQANLLPANLK